MSNRNKLNNNFAFLLKSTLALSLVTAGLAGKSFLKVGSSSGHVQLRDTTVKAAGMPDLSDVYYDEDTYQFQSGGAWRSIASSKYTTTLVNNVTMDGSTAIASENTSAVVLINIGDEKATGGNFTFGIQPNTVISSGSVQEITLQGHRYYGFSIGPSEVQAGLRKGGNLSFFNITGVPHVTYAGLPLKAPETSTTATLTLPSASFTENGKAASSAVVGKSVNITDDAGKTLGSITLKKEWINVTNDGTRAGKYSYTLNSAGIQAVKDVLAKLDGNYDFKTPGAATITISSKAAAKASLTVKYVDQKSGKTIKTDTSITGKVGDTGTYRVKLPSGYELATGQSQTLKYKLTADNSDDLTVKVVKKATKPGSSSSSSSKGSSGSKSSSSKGSNSNHASSSNSSNRGSSTHGSTTSESNSNNRVTAGSATVVLIDDDTGRIITRKVYSGPAGMTMNANFQDRISDLLRQGYNLVRSDLGGLTTVRLGTNAPVYELHFKKAELPPLQSAVARAADAKDTAKKSDADKKKSDKDKDKKKKDSKKKKSDKKKDSDSKEKADQHDINIEKLTNQTILRQALDKQYHGKKKRTFIERNQSPVIFDNSLQNVLDGLGGNGGGSEEEEMGLAGFFLALAGRVNFSEREPSRVASDS